MIIAICLFNQIFVKFPAFLLLTRGLFMVLYDLLKQKKVKRMTTQNYDIKKAENLSNLVQGFESEQAVKHLMTHRDRHDKLMAMELDGIVKLLDAVLEKNDEINQINIKMLNHFRNLHKKMVADYKVFDLMARTYNTPIISYKPREYIPITTKHQLRQIMNEFNNQHRM